MVLVYLPGAVDPQRLLVNYIIGGEFFGSIDAPGDESAHVEGEEFAPSDPQSGLLCSGNTSV